MCYNLKENSGAKGLNIVPMNFRHHKNNVHTLALIYEDEDNLNYI
jgi:hypothetical protein